MLNVEQPGARLLPGDIAARYDTNSDHQPDRQKFPPVLTRVCVACY